MARVSAAWLGLREPADAAARSAALVEHLVRRLPTRDRHVIHDLGCGTGSMGRWLAPLLPGSQHWVLHDQDGDLLQLATLHRPGQAAVTVEAKQSDVTQLDASALADASLITASALLDLLTSDELSALVEAFVAARCPVLLTLSVVGQVELSPADPLDSRLAAAFDAHQRRTSARGRLLGPDAVALAVEQFRGAGWEVLGRPSPWRLGPADAELAVEWLQGWVAAACEQEVGLTAAARPYTQRRLAQAAAGELTVTVGHADLLAVPQSV
jgi:hypothetical protein